jgi:hypothetical protein
VASAFAGLSNVVRNLQALAGKVQDRGAMALREEAEVEMTEAKRRTPVKTGALRASGHVSAVKRDGRSLSVDMSFGNQSVAYATYVHEDLEAFHRVGQAKFLESTLNESAPFIPARVAKRMNLEG